MDTKDDAQEKLRAAEEAFRFGVYRHKKGGLYVAFALTLNEPTLEILVHYASLEKRTRWTRTLENFTEGDRFSFDHPFAGDWLRIAGVGPRPKSEPPKQVPHGDFGPRGVNIVGEPIPDGEEIDGC